MLICEKCKKEMRCKTNGVRCRWNGSHVYSGDLFECPSCETRIINTGNVNAHFDDNYTETELDYYMDNFLERQKSNKLRHNINLRRK